MPGAKAWCLIAEGGMRMRWKMASAATVAAVVLAAAVGGPDPVAKADAAVPCSARALAAALASASSGATLSLATGCTYVLTAALPEVTQALTISGNNATL